MSVELWGPSGDQVAILAFRGTFLFFTSTGISGSESPSGCGSSLGASGRDIVENEHRPLEPSAAVQGVV